MNIYSYTIDVTVRINLAFHSELRPSSEEIEEAITEELKGKKEYDYKVVNFYIDSIDPR